MLEEDWVARVASIKQWSRGGTRAPHKPLLLLYALGRLANTGRSVVRFEDAEQPIKGLLNRYGPPGVGETPQYPFRRLETDGLWSVELSGSAPDPGDSRVMELRERATGRFPDRFESAMEDPALRAAVVRLLLEEHFAPSLHADLLAEVGLESVYAPVIQLHSSTAERPRRDPRFRDIVLTAYERACGFCGFDGLIDGATTGVEAAHVQWHAFGGPDTVANGIALCTLHHKLFDRGVIGLDKNHHIQVSQQFVGRADSSQRFVLSLVDQPLMGPQLGQPAPEGAFLSWHARQVFRGPARIAG